MVKYGMRDDAWIALGSHASHGSEPPHPSGRDSIRSSKERQRPRSGVLFALFP